MAPKKNKTHYGQLGGGGKQRSKRTNVGVYKPWKQAKKLQLLAGGIQVNVNIFGENGLSNVFRRKKMQYLKVNHSSNSDISAVSPKVKPSDICQAGKQQQNLNYLLP